MTPQKRANRGTKSSSSSAMGPPMMKTPLKKVSFKNSDTPTATPTGGGQFGAKKSLAVVEASPARGVTFLSGHRKKQSNECSIRFNTISWRVTVVRCEGNFHERVVEYFDL
eukprot:TRINITY_DN12562_c0_g1_i1.p1 TRINITY_DN12562_c0_g1~~TRINITY_DN12562_c0_g1_i1.p1  ORF type:complete len:111 (+),score=17.42 TRINITY_DN12562_c0_g1_i1:88-420(+)